MSRTVRITVDLPQAEYEAAKLVAGSAANVPGLMRKMLTEGIERWERNLRDDTSSSTGPTTRQPDSSRDRTP